MSVPTGFDSRDAVAANPSLTNPPRGRYEHLFHRTTPSIAVLWTNLHFLGQTQRPAALRVMSTRPNNPQTTARVHAP
jgi:hypothetical protein